MKKICSNSRSVWIQVVIALGIPLCLVAAAHAVRIKEIVEIQGVRQNQLVGYGLVVGLNGTGDGDKAKFTVQSLASMLEKMGMTVNPTDIKVKNIAAVMVTADMPPFARPGARMDISVSSIGDAKDLQGGTLLFTPLKAADGQTYAIGQGAISTGGFSTQGAGGSAQKNFPTVGRVIGGALIEKEVSSGFKNKESLLLTLNHQDFTTATRVAESINTAFSSSIARTSDSGSIDVRVPPKYADNVVGFVTVIEGLSVTPDQISKVVVNERTGTVVIGENVRISKVAIAQGNLSIQIKESADVSQPMPFSQGQTVATPNTNISVKEEKNPIYLMESGASIGEIVRALNALGVTPRDLISIFQALQAAGALQAKLEIM
ncbi:MAG: flagellar basal body P-ring protein FlgI [Deltaproteobacteria bacterium]|nr:flagellar basal body P-ring protein FlgI [Deltaproteobacteria bacterium]